MTPLTWLRVGVAGQRTRVYQTELEIQRCPFVGLSWSPATVSTYVSNLGWESPTVVLAAGVEFWAGLRPSGRVAAGAERTLQRATPGGRLPGGVPGVNPQLGAPSARAALKGGTYHAGCLESEVESLDAHGAR